MAVFTYGRSLHGGLVQALVFAGPRKVLGSRRHEVCSPHVSGLPPGSSMMWGRRRRAVHIRKDPRCGENREGRGQAVSSPVKAC